MAAATTTASGSFNISNDSSYYADPIDTVVDPIPTRPVVDTSSSSIVESPFSKNLTDTLNLGVTSTPVNNDIIIDIGHDGVDDFYIEGADSNPGYLGAPFSSIIDENDGDPIVIDFKRKS